MNVRILIFIVVISLIGNTYQYFELARRVSDFRSGMRDVSSYYENDYKVYSVMLDKMNGDDWEYVDNWLEAQSVFYNQELENTGVNGTQK